MFKIFRVIILGALFTMPALAQETAPIVYTGFPLFAKSITPNDGTDLTDFNGKSMDQSVYVGVGGDVSCVPSGNLTANPVTFVGVPAGSFVPVKCRRVRSTGTTATSLVGVY